MQIRLLSQPQPSPQSSGTGRRRRPNVAEGQPRQHAMPGCSCFLGGTDYPRNKTGRQRTARACPLRARRVGQTRSRAGTHGSSVISGDLRSARLELALALIPKLIVRVRFLSPVLRRTRRPAACTPQSPRLSPRCVAELSRIQIKAAPAAPLARPPPGSALGGARPARARRVGHCVHHIGSHRHGQVLRETHLSSAPIVQLAGTVSRLGRPFGRRFAMASPA